MLCYLYVFLATVLVDIIPFAGPPAWTVMVYLQLKYDLNVWQVITIGVAGSTLGRYVLSLYAPRVFGRFLNLEKLKDIQFIGGKLAGNGLAAQVFVVLYTLVPLPSAPLFIAAGIARVRPLHFLPAFFIGKFTSDMIMVLTGEFAAKNIVAITEGIFSFKSIFGAILGLAFIIIFLGINWRELFQNHRFSISFRIWK